MSEEQKEQKAQDTEQKDTRPEEIIEEPKAEEAAAGTAPAEEKPAEAPESAEEASTEEAAPEAEPKGPAFTPKTTAGTKPESCATCGKAIAKKLWYYRDNGYFCTKNCYLKKVEADRKAAEEAAAAE